LSTAELLAQAGEALFGPRWQGDLGRALKVDRRTVSRWSIGAQVPRPGVMIEVRELVRRRIAALTEVDIALTGWIEG
jgi:hypothetical protein